LLKPSLCQLSCWTSTEKSWRWEC